VHDLNLQLAVAETCESDRCQVTLIDDGRSLTALYSAQMINKMKIYPGQLVAINMDAAEPEIAWRWHRVRVREISAQAASVEDPVGRRIEVVRVPGLADTGLTIGDEVWITGFDPAKAMEIHARIVDNRPSQVDRLKALILPRVAEQVASRSGK
jgi:hypothetical protein